MSRVTELEKALTTLFRKGTEVGYTETEIDEFLENIDYHALLQAVWNKAETVYAYRADGKNALSLDYRSTELFKQRATLLYEDVGDSYIGAVFAARSMELWLLEDMGFAVVAKFSVNAGEGEYVTEYGQSHRTQHHFLPWKRGDSGNPPAASVPQPKKGVCVHRSGSGALRRSW